MRTTLDELLALGRPILADGATGTNYFGMGLGPGEPPEMWNLDHPEKVRELHAAFVAAGADVILTNTFGCNRYRLALHDAADRASEIARRAAELASEVAAAADRPVLVAGSVGPTGELLEPLGTMTEDSATQAFAEQIRGLRDGGAGIAWIETKSAAGEMRAAARAAIECGVPYAVTGSFDTAGRTMMGLAPAELGTVFRDLPAAPSAYGANCGVPHFEGTEIVYSGDPAVMAKYAALAVDSGARIIGGCCGTSPEHLAEMKHALEMHQPGPPPSLDEIVANVGPLANPVASSEPRERRTSRRRG